ncbi:hypothetical protein COCON_G00017470 [Conger conger]|uniref:RRM domain-containing protein n=1 Tax=Conger conger TaxID=82655 RepID=A0A9Q1E3V5_CONCO|nr:hypothetical protein COCON_G00017470 [Conger conger]
MSGCRVFIGRLSPHARERDVEKFFKGYGRIREINLKNGFGFVEFDDHRDADDAVYELNGKELCSERVTIEHARSRRGRGGGPGAGGGGGGGTILPSLQWLPPVAQRKLPIRPTRSHGAQNHCGESLLPDQLAVADGLYLGWAP